ncbi:hypothetical protein IJU97_00075 [bacterium]|nr:hypothetical protein [bacterium]
MLDLSDFFEQYWIMIFLIVVGVVVGYKVAYSKVVIFKVFMDTLFVKVPVI